VLLTSDVRKRVAEERLEVVKVLGDGLGEVGVVVLDVGVVHEERRPVVILHHLALLNVITAGSVRIGRAYRGDSPRQLARELLEELLKVLAHGVGELVFRQVARARHRSSREAGAGRQGRCGARRRRVTERFGALFPCGVKRGGRSKLLGVPKTKGLSPRLFFY
tara:strand:+ start:1612 stop:2103 length:492 start_codon:yes stop_codon:yes gene_type:complete